MFGFEATKDSSQSTAWRRLFAALGVLATFGLAGLAGCGSDVEAPEPEPDPMEMRRYYPAPDWSYQLHPAVRLVNPKTPSGQRKPMIIASNVYRLPDGTASRADVGEDAVSLPLEGNEWLRRRKVGDIVISEKNGILWRRITEIREVDDRIEWTTEAAKLTEVFQKADFYLQIDTSKIDPDRVGELDLAMPYLRPNSPPQISDTRTSALHGSDSCPEAPSCDKAGGGTVCVLENNPEVACPVKIPGECASLAPKYSCKKRPSCVVNDGDPKTMERCPEEDRGSCDTLDGACRPVYTCDLSDAVLTYSKSHVVADVPNSDVSYVSHSAPFSSDEFGCAEVVGRPLCVVKTCTDNSECANYKTVQDENGDDVEVETGNFEEADGERGYACRKISDGDNCTSGGNACSSDSDCCSQNCADTQVIKTDAEGRTVFDDNGDPVKENAKRCRPSQKGYCHRVCSEGPPSKQHNEDGVLASLLKELILSEVGPEAPTSSLQFVDDVTLDLKFKPDIEFILSIDWFTLEKIGLIIGADFLARLGLSFSFDESEDYPWQGQHEITIFQFSILGYPFDVKLNIHGSLLLTAAAKGEIRPEFLFYTHKDSGETWEEEHQDKLSDPRDTYLGNELPGIWDDSGQFPGVAMGMLWQGEGDPCKEDPYKDWDVCGNVSGNFYKLSRSKTTKVFSPGVDADLDVSATAELGVNVGIYDKGLFRGSRLIGIEPINMLGNMYATMHSPFCAVGASLFYRMFLLFGPLDFLDERLLPEIRFPILVKKIWGQDWLIPSDFSVDCSIEDDEKRHWSCDLANDLGCGYPPAEEPPSTSSQPCDDSSNCAADERCVNKQCIGHPNGSLRITLKWQGRSNFNLNVEVLPSGERFTLNNSPKRGDGSCSGDGTACFEDICGSPSACPGAGKYAESLVIENPSAERYRIWVANHGGNDDGFGGAYNIEIEHDGRIEDFGGLLPAQQTSPTGADAPTRSTISPMKFVYNATGSL